MSPSTAERSPLGRFRMSIGLLAASCLGLVSGICGGGALPPKVTLTLSDAARNPGTEYGFVINVGFTQTTDPILPGSFGLLQQRWGEETTQTIQAVSVDATGGVAILPAGKALAEGTHTLAATVWDTAGRLGHATIDFAVRELPSPPIGTGQLLWFDFEVDRDGDLAPDFPADLQLFGLGSPADPALSAVVEEAVRAATLARIQEAFWDQSSSGLPGPDPVDVGIFDADPGPSTRICVGGLDPTGGATIGNIQIDPNNANRYSVECSSLPVPTGIFPGELTNYSGQSAFQETFDPLQTSRGGTPVGEHALDPIVLDPGFDYASASPEEQARHDDVFTAIERFADALGSICAHEAGHALGLVPPAAPGVGLYGGQSGAEFSHALTPAGGEPPENHLMKAGPTFDFAELAGIWGNPLPAFRPLNWAYLRDRTLTDSSILALLPPPQVFSVTPNVIDQSALVITVTGEDFSGTPVIRLQNAGFTYDTPGETWIDPQTATAWVVRSQILPGLYDLLYVNSDGQEALLPDAVTVP